MSYLERLSSLLALMPAPRATFSSFHIKRLQETKLNPVVVLSIIRVFLEKAELM